MTHDPFGPSVGGTGPLNAGLNGIPLRQRLRAGFLGGVCLAAIGLNLSLIEAHGDAGDLATQRNRGAAELALLLYLFSIFSVAFHTVFDKPGVVSLLPVLMAGGLTLLFQRIDSWLHVRGLYHSGRQEMIKAGAKLGFSGEDVAWHVAVAMRSFLGIVTAVTVGGITGQTIFTSEEDAYLTKLEAEKNAPIIAIHTATVEQDLKFARDAVKRAEDEAASVRKNTGSLRAQEIANVRAAAHQGRVPPKPSVENARAMTSSALQGFEAKSAAADKGAQDATKTYEAKLAARGETIRAMVEADPRYINVAHGLLARLQATRALAHEDSLVGAGVLAVDGIGISLELFVLVFFACQAPTRLAASLYCEHLKSTTAAARDLVIALKTPLPPQDDDTPPSAPQGPTDGPTPRGHGGSDMAPPIPQVLDGHEQQTPRAPGPRPRGRPRKHPLPVTLNGSALNSQGGQP